MLSHLFSQVRNTRQEWWSSWVGCSHISVMGAALLPLADHLYWINPSHLSFSVLLRALLRSHICILKSSLPTLLISPIRNQNANVCKCKGITHEGSRTISFWKRRSASPPWLGLHVGRLPGSSHGVVNHRKRGFALIGQDSLGACVEPCWRVLQDLRWGTIVRHEP